MVVGLSNKAMFLYFNDGSGNDTFFLVTNRIVDQLPAYITEYSPHAKCSVYLRPLLDAPFDICWEVLLLDERFFSTSKEMQSGANW